MTKKEKDRNSSLFLLVVAIGICYGSVKLSLGHLHRPGPGFFSLVAGAVLGILSFFVFLKSLKKAWAEEKIAFWPNPRRTLKMGYVLIALILYAIGMNYLGFFVTTLLFLGFLLRGIDPQRWPVVLAVSILGAVISYYVFQHWLDVQLPVGILGF
jgi:putative tricarboxylic transport membrane protein